ncbi:sulfurtransferase complex subunit TusB [Pontibacterium sp.]|uniref:sulfurtransferase complex subunit TusB n=1 Tax=Pontibacterium sp. TaxID=2036026 RepID=UPI003515367D
MALHTLNQPPGNAQCLERCLNALADGDALLLIEDGVLATLPAHASRFDAIAANVTLFALQADLDARGLNDLKGTRFTVVDDGGFVELACEQDKVVSWY